MTELTSRILQWMGTHPGWVTEEVLRSPVLGADDATLSEIRECPEVQVKKNEDGTISYKL